MESEKDLFQDLYMQSWEDVTFKIIKQPVTAKPRQLTATWSYQYDEDPRRESFGSLVRRISADSGGS